MVWVAILILTWTEGRKTFGFGEITGIFVAVLAAFGLLFALDRYFNKSKSGQWMSAYYICLAVLFGLSVVVLILMVLRSYG